MTDPRQTTEPTPDSPAGPTSLREAVHAALRGVHGPDCYCLGVVMGHFQIGDLVF